jgi:hypothetical protein
MHSSFWATSSAAMSDTVPLSVPISTLPIPTSSGAVYFHVPTAPNTSPVPLPTGSNPRKHNYINLLNRSCEQWGVTVRGKATKVAFQSDKTHQLICSECQRKLQKQSCQVDFTFSISASKDTQEAELKCTSIVCENCITEDTVHEKVDRARKMKKKPRARKCARTIVGCISPLIRLCATEKAVRTFEHAADVVVALITVVIFGIILFLVMPRG